MTNRIESIAYKKLRSNDFEAQDNSMDGSSDFHSEHLAYSEIDSSEITTRPLSDDELLTAATSFDEAMGAYHRIARRNVAKNIVSKVVTLDDRKPLKIDPTTSLTYLERIAHEFADTMTPKESKKINRLIVKQLDKLSRRPVDETSVVTLERVAAATDILPDNLKDNGIRAFEETLNTMEIDLPLAGEIKLPEATAKAAHQAIEIYQKMPDPTSLKKHFDAIGNKSSFAEINEFELQRSKQHNDKIKHEHSALDTMPGAKMSAEDLFGDD